MNEDLIPFVPQTYGEAVKFWGLLLIDCDSHEWDNRTTEENAAYLLGRLAEKRPNECPGHDRGGKLKPCCDRAGQYNGFASGPLLFHCPSHCSCHD